MRSLLSTLAMLCLAAAPSSALQTPDAASIMAQVAANQDRSQVERSRYVYVQHARIISRKGKTVQCEEVTDARITPKEKTSEQHLLKLDGRIRTAHGYVDYHEPAKDRGKSNMEPGDKSTGVTLSSDGSMDRDMVETMRDNLTQDKSKDGIGEKLFPLTTGSQAELLFTLVGTERINGREVFHIGFTPRDKDDYTWKGDAYIDTTALQPVVVRTTQARKLPFAVRTLLGTSLPGLGFTVIYAPQVGGVWFPVSFGTEFKLHVLFFFHREITMAVDNKQFERTHATSTLLEGSTPVEPAP